MPQRGESDNITIVLLGESSYLRQFQKPLGSPQIGYLWARGPLLLQLWLVCKANMLYDSTNAEETDCVATFLGGYGWGSLF